MEGPSLRRYLRVPLAHRVRVQTTGSKRRRFTVRPRSADLSMGGLFVDGRTLPAGTQVELTIQSRPPIRARGTVRFTSTRPRKGIGIEFTELAAQDLERLADLLARTPWP